MTSVSTGDDLVVTLERKPGSQVALSVEAPAAEADAAVEKALRSLARQVRLPGFRPGKAPAHLVERAVGWDTVRRQAIDEALPRLYTRALEKAGVDAVGDPEVGDVDLDRGKPVTFTAVVTVKPDVDLGDYLAMRVEEERTEITDEKVDEAVEDVRRRHSELVDVTDRPVQAGDVLRATLVMRRGDEVLGGEGEERDVEVDRERLLPGLADALIGLASGDTHSVDLTLPDDYSREELRGVAVTVEAHVLAIRERRLPPLDDSLAALDGHGSTLAELREHYRTLLEDAAKRSDDERFEATVLERLRDTAVVDVPEVMVDREVDRQLRDMELRLAQAGLRFDRFLEYSGQTVEQVRGERRESAVQRVKLELVLEELAEREGLEVDEAEVEREVDRVAAGARVSAEQRHRLHHVAHHDLLLRGAGRRALEIARGG